MENLFIGGNFDTNPWQRGTSFPNFPSGYTADRWRTSFASSYGLKINVSKMLDAPTFAQAGYYTQSSLGVTVVTGTPTLGPTDGLYTLQLVEGYNFLPIAQQVSTISFWVKASLPGIYCFVCHNAAADKSMIAEYTINNANTWEYKTVTIPPSPSSGTWDYTNGEGITCQFMLGAGSSRIGVLGWQDGGVYITANQVNALATAGNTWQIALAKWEVGPVATPFKGRSIQEELLLCQRYYYKTFPFGSPPRQNAGVSNGAIGYRVSNAGVNNAGSFLRFPVEMRAIPSVEHYSPFAANDKWFNQSTGISSGVYYSASVSTNGIFANNIQTASDGVGSYILIHLTCEAEL